MRFAGGPAIARSRNGMQGDHLSAHRHRHRAAALAAVPRLARAAAPARPRGLGSRLTDRLTGRLARRDAPFILYTGMHRDEPRLMEWRDYPIVEKPASPHTLVSAIRTILAREPRRRQGER